VLASNLLIYHGYDEILLDGRWVAADAALSQEVCKQSGIIPIEFDGIRDADYRLHNQKEIFYELVIDHGAFPDLPYGEMMSAMDAGYGIGPASIFKQMPLKP
jgi:hypothetical protein